MLRGFFLAAINPVFSATWSSEIIVSGFGAEEINSYYQCWKKLFYIISKYIFMKTTTIFFSFRILWLIKKISIYLKHKNVE